jgi:hypothetical protein
MDTFIAAIRIRDTAPACAELLKPLAAAIASITNPAAPTTPISWADRQIAFAGVTRVVASDAAYAAADDRLLYIDGPVSTSQAGAEQAAFGGCYHERLAAVNHAIDLWLRQTEGLAALSGSFCAFWHDRTAARTLVIADRLGSRPIFSCSTADWLYIASDIRPLLQLPGFTPKLDRESLAQFIRYQMILEDRTLYANIKTLPAAAVLSIDHRSGEQRLSSYWSFAPLPFFSTQQEAIEATAQAFQQATQRIVADSRKLGILLSGGFDSRMLLTSLDQHNGPPLHAYTFGPGLSDEAGVARQVAQTCAVPWHFLEQPLDTYWEHLPPGILGSNGLHAAGHMHLQHPTSVMTEAGCDTVLNGWGFDLPYSGSYFPKETFHVLGRQLYSYRLVKIRTQQAVVDHLHTTFDMQAGRFANSLLGAELREHWEGAPQSALADLVARAASASPSPYDWIDYTLFGFGVTKFRSYSMLMNVRSQARERNPLFESDIIEAYQKLPYQWRFLGHVFRRAVRQLDPVVAAIPYSNIGISAFAPPIVQAVAMQGRATWRANLARARGLGRRITGSAPAQERPAYGSYHESFDMARYLQADAPLARQVADLLHRGPLVKAGILDPGLIEPALERCRAGLDRSGFTLMAWVALALWLERHPTDLA